MGEGCHDIASLVLKYISFISEYFIYFTLHVYLVLNSRSSCDLVFTRSSAVY